MRLPNNRALAFLAVLLGPTVLGMVAAFSLNAYIDPYWVVPIFGERAGIRYCVDDERQNKINKMIYGGARAESVLIGSSRSAFFDTRYFQARVFNLAVNGLRPVEYPEYLRILSQHVGALKDIFLGLDFFGYLVEVNDVVWVDHAKEKEKFALSGGYRLNLLFDLGSLEKSIKTLTECSSVSYATVPAHRYDGVRLVGRSPQNQDLLKSQFKFFADLYKAPADGQFREYMRRIKRAVPGSRIHVYIPPISAELFRTIIESGKADDYRQWLAILVEEFGSVVQFSGLNSFTTNPENFYDTHHVYPERTEKIIGILEGRLPPDKDGFGRLITRSSPEQD